MSTSILDPTIQAAIAAIREDGAFPSPTDWRDVWIYLLMIDRFNNPAAPPASTTGNPPSAWNERYGYRQGGTFKGIEARLDYLATLGVGALWITPVLKNSMAPGWEYNYHGYGIQDFLAIDGRFASDGTEATAPISSAAAATASPTPVPRPDNLSKETSTPCASWSWNMRLPPRTSRP